MEMKKTESEGNRILSQLVCRMQKIRNRTACDIVALRNSVVFSGKYDGWRSRKMIDFYKTYVKAVFEEYKDEVKYWLTFNEINSILESPFMSGAIMTPKDELTEEQLYQAAHHELTASAWAVKIGHKINPDFKIGCMILSVPVYPLTPEPDDVLAAKEQEHKSLMFADVHVRGKYPGYALRYFREHGISLEIEEADREVLKETVDFISLSYYMSACATAHSERCEEVKEIYWEAFLIRC